MTRRIGLFSFIFSLLFICFICPKHSSAAPKFDIGKLKPAKIDKTLIQKVPTVPPRDAVKEIGGIQYGKHIDITLKNGNVVRCLPAATNDPNRPSKNYYYLPTSPRVARGPDGVPKFSLIRFVTDKTKEAGGVDGAIIHFLAEYGLTPKEKQELKMALRKMVPGAVLKGAVPLEVEAEGNSFYIVSAVLNNKGGFTSNLVTSGKAPVMEGQKVAAAARLDSYGATLLAKSLEMPTSDISVVFDLKYVVKLPAYDIKVTIDYETFNTIQEKYTHTREKKTKRKSYWDPKWYNIFNRSSKNEVVSLTEKEQRNFVDFLKESGVVTFEYNQHVPEANKKIVEGGLYKLVLESFFDMQRRFGTPPSEETAGNEDSGKDAKNREDVRRREAASARKYTYTMFKRKNITRKSKQTLWLKESIARYEYFSMTGNVGGWYKKFKNDPKLVAEVNLDDPFFQRREMRFVIDNETYDIFKNVVNYATIQVRVPRKGQRPFIDEVTIDRKYLEQNGQTATLTYARMGDDAQTYQYAVQWSLRGGHLYPSVPKWQNGDLMAVTLAAPITPMTVEAEADLDELSELGVARVSVELKYKRFGRVYHDRKGLALSPALGDPIASKTIYHDRNDNRIQYRLVFHHKKLGKVVGEWSTMDGAYVFCSPSAAVVEKLKGML